MFSWPSFRQGERSEGWPESKAQGCERLLLRVGSIYKQFVL